MTPELTIRSFSTDQYTLDKVFYSNFYRLKAATSDDNRPVVVDIGAHCGYFSFAAATLGAKKVYAFEPFIENYRMLIKNTTAHSTFPIIPFQIGAYVSDGLHYLHYPQFKSEDKQLDFAKLELDGAGEVKAGCQFLTLDKLLGHFVPESIDLLKISIGYAEADILKASELTNVKHICGETVMNLEAQEKFKVSMAAKGFLDTYFVPSDNNNEEVMFQISRGRADEMFL